VIASGLPTKDCVCTIIIPPLRVTCLAQPNLLYFITFMILGTKLLTAASCHFIPLRSKRSPQHPVLKQPQSVLFPRGDTTFQHPYKATSKTISQTHSMPKVRTRFDTEVFMYLGCGKRNKAEFCGLQPPAGNRNCWSTARCINEVR
jgi:hypothetical protein